MIFLNGPLQEAQVWHHSRPSLTFQKSCKVSQKEKNFERRKAKSVSYLFFIIQPLKWHSILNETSELDSFWRADGFIFWLFMCWCLSFLGIPWLFHKQLFDLMVMASVTPQYSTNKAMTQPTSNLHPAIVCHCNNDSSAFACFWSFIMSHQHISEITDRLEIKKIVWTQIKFQIF